MSTANIPQTTSTGPKDSPPRGRFGSCKGTPLTANAIAGLSNGDKVEVVWDGGNGPHIYEIRNDLDPLELVFRSPFVVSSTKLLKDARFVALANAKPSDGAPTL